MVHSCHPTYPGRRSQEQVHSVQITLCTAKIRKKERRKGRGIKQKEAETYQHERHTLPDFDSTEGKMELLSCEKGNLVDCSRSRDQEFAFFLVAGIEFRTSYLPGSYCASELFCWSGICFYSCCVSVFPDTCRSVAQTGQQASLKIRR